MLYGIPNMPKSGPYNMKIGHASISEDDTIWDDPFVYIVQTESDEHERQARDQLLSWLDFVGTKLIDIKHKNETWTLFEILGVPEMNILNHSCKSFSL